MSQKSSHTLPAAATIMALIIGVMGYYIYNLQSEIQIKEDKALSVRSQMETTYHRLDSLSQELAKKISQLEELGISVTELKEEKTRLENEKYQLRMSKSITDENFRKIQDRLLMYEELLLQKDLEISRLTNNNHELTSRVDSLTQGVDSLRFKMDSILSETDVLNRKIRRASLLVPKTITACALNKNGKERSGESFRPGQAESLEITLVLAPNEVAPIGDKEIFLQLIEPGGNVLFDRRTGAGKFGEGDDQMFCSLVKKFYFDNSEQKIVFNFVKGNDYRKGEHELRFYSEGELIGQKKFTVK